MKTVIGQQHAVPTQIQSTEKGIQADPLSVAAIAGVFILGVAQILPKILEGWAKSQQEQTSVEIERERGENKSRENIVQTLITQNKTFTEALLQSIRQDREEFLESLRKQQEIMLKMQERADTQSEILKEIQIGLERMLYKQENMEAQLKGLGETQLQG